MPLDPHTPCAGTDHVHWQYNVMWCPHRQQFTVTRSTHLETGTDADPVGYELSILPLGPFDQASVVVMTLVDWIESDAQLWLPPGPRLPG